MGPTSGRGDEFGRLRVRMCYKLRLKGKLRISGIGVRELGSSMSEELVREDEYGIKGRRRWE